MKTYHAHGLIGLLIIITACAIVPALGQGQKVSERTALSAENLAPSTDVIGIVDISAGASGSKKITVNNLFTGWGFTAAGSDLAKAANVPAQRSLLGMGTAALQNHGTSAGDLVRLDVTTGKLPAVDGSLLTGLPVGTVLTDSASLRSALSDETGSGAAVFGTSPTIATPVITTPTINIGSDATGDIFYRSSGGGLARLAAGTNGHVLTLSGGLPSWAAASAGGIEGTAVLSTGETGGVKFLREDGDGTSSWQTITGGGDALVANPLSQFAATTSGQLAGVLTNETGSGVAVFGTSPTIATPVITTPTINIGSDATGDILYRSSGGGLARLAAGTDGHVLTLSGGLPTWAAASGGGGALTHWTEAAASTSVNSTIPTVSLAATNAASSVDVALVPKLNGSLLAAVPDGGTTGGNKRGPQAVDWQLTRSTAAQVASGTNATCAGGGGNTASGQFASVLGGSTNVASGYSASVLGGTTNTASGDFSTALGGSDNLASGSYSLASGTRATARGLYGAAAHAAGRFTVNGDAQTARYVLMKSVTSGAAAEAFLGAQSASSTSRIVLPNNSAYGFKVHAVARYNSTGDVKVWRQEGAIKRGANAASTALVGTVTEAVTEDSGASSWDLNVTADTTNGSLKFEVVGAGFSSTRFVIHVETVELVH